MSEDERLDRERIRQLMARYTLNGDRGRIDALASTFAEDGVLAFSGLETRGRAAIIARLGGAGDRNPALTLSRHHLTSSLVEIEGEVASGRTYFQVLTDIGLDHHGVYVDRLAQSGGEWLFKRREVRIDWQAGASLYPRFNLRGKPPAS